MPGLGRIYKPDSRDHDFRMEDALAKMAAAPLPHMVMWTPGPILDQGQTPHCVGFGWRAHLNAAPNPELALGPDGDGLYYAAKILDGEPNAEDGSSVRTGAKVCLNDKLIKANGINAKYLWAHAEWTIRKWVLTQSPVVIGIDWYDSMFNPDSEHIISVAPNATLAGGHCLCIVGYDYSGFGKSQKQLYKIQNSWGTGWGDGGFCYMTFQTLSTLMAESGEACTVVNV